MSARFGLTAITFAEEVPEHWRPYQLLNLANALAELQRLMPATALRGLTIRFAALGEGTRALAVHDPRTRVLTLPPATGAGAIAHEIAHDLDWQLSQRRYGRRASYATDRAVSSGRRDRVASSLGAMAAALAAESGVKRRRPRTMFAQRRPSRAASTG